MSEEQDVTLGEVYRLCKDIHTEVKQTNERVTTAEKDIVRIKAYWSAGTVAFALLGDTIKHKLGIS